MARILVLDDSPLVLNATRAVLESAGHRVSTVADPPHFFALLDSERPDLALVDVSMPTLEGDAVVWIARAHQLQACLIVLYSAKSERELEGLVASSGADGYICKTDDNALLLRQIVGFLSRKPSDPSGHEPG